MLKRKLINTGTIISMSVLVLSSCINNRINYPGTATQVTETQAPIESELSDTSTPITVKLILSKAPRLNELAELTFIISSIKNAHDTKATITIPDGTVLISGDLEWVGNLDANIPKTMKATIKFVTEGNKTLEAKALYELGNGDIWGDVAYIYLYTSIEAGHVGFSPQPQLGTNNTEPTPPGTIPNP